MQSLYLSLYLHIYISTYRGTHTQAHMYARGMATTRHKSPGLVGRGGRKAFVRDKGLVHAKKCKKRKKKQTIVSI